jgi:hypothetical protein
MIAQKLFSQVFGGKKLAEKAEKQKKSHRTQIRK